MKTKFRVNLFSICLFMLLNLPLFGQPCQESDLLCSYRISRFAENEYVMIRNIMQHLLENHWNVTWTYLNFYFEPNIRFCDHYIEQKSVNEVVRKDFRHPNFLFRHVNKTKINATIMQQYEIEWFEKYKQIKYDLQSKKYLNICNKLGLKIYYLLFDYVKEQSNIFKCSSQLNQEEPVITLLDYYIAQTMLKNCFGNIELLARSIHKLLRYDCERVHQFKIAYAYSKYLNMFRVCNSSLSVNDLANSGKFDNCTNTHYLNSTVNKKYCTWFELVCKYPASCIESLGPNRTELVV